MEKFLRSPFSLLLLPFSFSSSFFTSLENISGIPVHDFVSGIRVNYGRISRGGELTLNVQCCANDGISKLFNVSLTVMRII